MTRKILVTAAAGAVTFALTNLTRQPQSTALTLSVLIGGIALIAQFLAGFESRQRGVEERLTTLERRHADATVEMKATINSEIANINQATRLFEEVGRLPITALSADRLASIVAGLAGLGPSLASRLAQAELESALVLAERLAGSGDITYEGEDRDWLWALTRHVAESMDATSRASGLPGGGFADEGFWDSEIGSRYLEWQREAIDRGVRIRRLFVIDQAAVISSAGFRKMLREQEEVGVGVRILDASAVSPARRLLIPDIVLFDRQLAYELVPASKFGADAVPYFVKTRLLLETGVVTRHLRTFEELWQAAEPPADAQRRASRRSPPAPAT